MYRQAAATDSLSPEPPSRLAQVAIRHWQFNPVKEAARFDEAVEYQRQANSLDPQSPWGHRTLAMWYADRYRRYEKVEDGISAEEAMSQAVKRYPASAALQSDLAIVQATVGKSQQAAETASQAIALDRINREEGHSDKWLEAPTLERLEKILSPAKETP